jgi:putative ribosome biogenesis GTPase RsgA
MWCRGALPCLQVSAMFNEARSLAQLGWRAFYSQQLAVGVLASLAPWLGKGQTVAFVGSSAVGKSTLVNSLLGADEQATREIRAADDKGRRTPGARYLLPAPWRMADRHARHARPESRCGTLRPCSNVCRCRLAHR